MVSEVADSFEKMMRNRRYQYWFLQIFGWSGYTFFAILGSWLWDKDELSYSSYVILAAIMGLLFTMVMRRSFQAMWDRPPIVRGLLTLLTVGVCTALWAWWKLYIFFSIFRHKEAESMLVEYVTWIPISLYIFLCWTGLYYGIKYYQMMHQEREKTLRVTSMAHQAQLKMLRYQLNPHFLFNTLNAISTLIMEGKSEIANSMVSKLSKFLRYSLDKDPMHKVSLEQEVEAMRLYLDIEKVRFEERLQLQFQLDEEAKQALIPSMLLQPLVENAIKYAVAKSETGGTIQLAAKVFAGELLMELSDDGPGIELVDGQLPENNGVGLNNTRERLRELYGDNYSCQFSNAEPHGLKINIRIPYVTEKSGTA